MSGKFMLEVSADKVQAQGDAVDIGVYRRTNPLYE